MTLSDIYQRSQELGEIATRFNDDNWNSSANLGEQTARLTDIIEIASELEPIYADLASVLSDEE